MRRNNNYLLSDVADNHILVPVADAISLLNGVIALSESGCIIWKLLEKEQSVEDLVKAVLLEYEGVSENQVKEDVVVFLNQLRDYGCLEE